MKTTPITTPSNELPPTNFGRRLGWNTFSRPISTHCTRCLPTNSARLFTRERPRLREKRLRRVHHWRFACLAVAGTPFIAVWLLAYSGRVWAVRAVLLPSPTIEQDGRVRARGEFEFFVLQVTPKRVVIAISRLVLNLDSSIHGSVSVCPCPSVCMCEKVSIVRSESVP